MGFVLDAPSSRTSLKRRRGVLGLGYAAGCSLLLGPAHAGVLSFLESGVGTVWFSPALVTHVNHNRHANEDLGHLQQDDYTRHGNHGLDPTQRRNGEGPYRESGLRRTGLRHLTVGAHFQAAVGEWSECSKDCRHTRTVLCETQEFKIVPNHLCGDELPLSEEQCEPDACVAVEDDNQAEATIQAESNKSDERDDLHPEKPSSEQSQARDSKAKSPGGGNPVATAHKEDERPESSAVSPSGVKETEKPEVSSKGLPANHGDGLSPSENKKASAPKDRGHTVDKGAAERASIAKSNAEAHAALGRGSGERWASFSSSDTGRRQAGREHKADDPHLVPGGASKEDPGSAAESDSHPSRAKPTENRGQGSAANGGTDTVATEGDGSHPSHSGEKALEGELVEDHGNVRSATTETGRPSKGGSAPGSTTNLRPTENLQSLSRIGDGIGSREDRRQRSWLVLGIGVAAVGSLLAALVFAVGQYRKEQHRLRGIMALEEFPVDNYVNPFCAREYSEEERSAFKL